MAGDDFPVKLKIYAQIGVFCDSRNLIIRGQRKTFETSKQPAGLKTRGLFLGYVSAVKHNGKCQIRGRRSTFEGWKSLTAGDDFRQKSQISRARWSLPRGPEPHKRGQRSTLETLRQAAVLGPQGRFLATLFLHSAL